MSRSGPATRVLLLDDTATVRADLHDHLQTRGFEVVETDTCARALEAFSGSRFDAAVIDYLLPDGTALELLPRFKELAPQVPVVVLTGHGSIDLAVRALQQGADHFLTKPADPAALQAVIEKLLESARERRQCLARKAERQRRPVNPFLGTSAAIRQLESEARRVLQTDRPVLLTGETGSGKGVLASWLHENGPRADEPFVDLNCAGLSREFLETELFGHEKGAFTGAVQAKMGLLEVADRGTLFLDEIADMDPLVQPKLLKVLEEGRFRRMGAVRDRVVDVRLIAASHPGLAELVREKCFRQDLYFRISTLPLVVPPLRERREDIPLLAAYLLEPIAADMGRPRPRLTPDAAAVLQAWSWPGNVRELRNVLERAVLLHEGEAIGAAELRFDAPQAPAAAESDLSLLEMEKRHIAAVLRRLDWRVEEAAALLHVPRSSLYQKIKRFGLQRP